MIPDIKYLSVNWQDGMKVKSGHFVALENFLKDNLRDSINISYDEYSYGLLPASEGSSSPIKIKCDTLSDNQQIKVVLITCRAITAGGIRIERSEEDNILPGSSWIECLFPLDKRTDERLDIVISVDLFSRIAVGDPDPSENPPRRPYVTPKYVLKLHTAGSPINQINELKLGEIIFENGHAKLSENYIPPCARVNCYAALYDKYQKFDDKLKLLEKNTINILQKLKAGKTPEGAESDILHDNLKFLVEQMVFFLANTYEWYRRIIPQSPPLFFTEYFLRLARIINTTLKCMTDPARHSLLNYFRQWGIDFEPGNFENALVKTLELNYDHTNIKATLDQIEAFLFPLSQLLDTLPKREFRDFDIDIIQSME